MKNLLSYSLLFTFWGSVGFCNRIAANAEIHGYNIQVGILSRQEGFNSISFRSYFSGNVPVLGSCVYI